MLYTENQQQMFWCLINMLTVTEVRNKKEVTLHQFIKYNKNNTNAVKLLI